MKVRAPFNLRNFAADTFAMVVFCFITGMAIEVFISGLSFEKSLASRLVSIPVNIAIAVPYGLYRDWVVRQGAKVATGSFAKNVSDLFAFVTFQSPVYVAILLSVGASTEQIISAVSVNAALSCGMGILYGYFLDSCRKMFRVPGYQGA
ncbi:L-alanine exporter AlaE [Vibrio hannami]|uniref:L-alanine exporter AlaE n=1 Tax=Vibrio hannami TaxID=2717094 RepID=UPI0024105654|nr:L-alanine exporter AlaE [Vibrio hannami]MDG3087725.1 L-alanine exporter AlaE [Vibrio hannami]